MWASDMYLRDASEVDSRDGAEVDLTWATSGFQMACIWIVYALRMEFTCATDELRYGLQGCVRYGVEM